MWEDIIIEEHNRYDICVKHNISFNTVQKEFASRDEVKLWMLQNQLSRRNLNDFQRVELVRRWEDIIKAQAKERQLSGLVQNESTIRENLPERENEVKKATEELGELAGVSRKTYEHAVIVLDKAPEAVIQSTRDKELSINAAFEITQLPEEQQTEIAERIEQGEKPKAVVSSIRKAREKAQPEATDKQIENKSESDIPETTVVEPTEFLGTLETLQTESETSKKEFVIIELLEVTETFHRIMGKEQSDCVMFFWLKPNDMQKLFNAIISTGSELKYHDLALFGRMHEGIIKSVCIVGTRGKSKVTTEIQPRVIEAEAEEDEKHPKLFDDMVSGMF